jgi:uncharacterized phage protein gp47/JayE
MPPQSITDLVYIDATGYHFADFPTFLAWVTASYQSVYGSDVYIAPNSLDGQWIAIQAQAYYDMAAMGASVYNSFSPLTGQGTGLSRTVQINGLTRDVPSFSTVPLTIVGVENTVILNGIAADTLNQQWILPASVTIPSGGSIIVTATAQSVGAVFADIGTVTTIFTPTNGWQTVNNASAATPGQPVETDAELRIRQAKSTALPALTPLDSTVAAVSNVPEVTDCVGYENATGTTQATTNLPPHSICIVVAGSPDSTAVAQAIQIKKTPGTQTYGPSPTTVTVFDSQGMPIAINYQAAISAEIQVQVSLTRLSGWSSDFEALIQASVAAVINSIPIGGSGNSGTGGSVYISQLYTAAYLNGAPQGQTYDISSIELGKNGGGLSTSNVSILFDEEPVCAPSTDITFVVT